MEFIRVENSGETGRVAELAGLIWPEHYTPIIGGPQVEYMLKRFQTVAGIVEQIKNGVSYYIIVNDEGKDAGYMALEIRKTGIYLSKLYLLSFERNRGLGRKAVGFAEKAAYSTKLKSISLNVNKNNHSSVAAYKKFGFTVVRTVVLDIGGGFFMDDYVMEKILPPDTRI
jgi:ribosomal protein S18 acetylase RimI-like enzyme